MAGSAEPVTYLVVDGENIDTTLGVQVLEHRPTPEERPRWERLRQFAGEVWQQPVKALFFLNASSGALPTPFVRALLALEYRPVALTGSPGQKVVDIGIQRTLEAIGRRSGDVLLASHDGDFLPQIGQLVAARRRVGVIGFPEFFNAGFTGLVEAGLQLFDLEEDARCFTSVLPRVRIIHVDDFDPERFL